MYAFEMPPNPPAPPALLVPAADAQKTAAAFATAQLADILQAGTPYLVTTAHGLCWRVPLHLSHAALVPRTAHPLALDISTQTGQPLLTAAQQHALQLQIYQAFRHMLR
jgi:hypothetical protein